VLVDNACNQFLANSRLSRDQDCRFVVLIAMAIMHSPALLIADEPSSALDVIAQSEIIKLSAELNCSIGSAVLYISHDLVSVASICHRIAILHNGEIVECGSLDAVLTRPVHPYTQQLMACVPWLSKPAPATSVPKPVADPPKAIIPGILNRTVHFPMAFWN